MEVAFLDLLDNFPLDRFTNVPLNNLRMVLRPQKLCTTTNGPLTSLRQLRRPSDTITRCSGQGYVSVLMGVSSGCLIARLREFCSSLFGFDEGDRAGNTKGRPSFTGTRICRLRPNERRVEYKSLSITRDT